MRFVCPSKYWLLGFINGHILLYFNWLFLMKKVQFLWSWSDHNWCDHHEANGGFTCLSIIQQIATQAQWKIGQMRSIRKSPCISYMLIQMLNLKANVYSFFSSILIWINKSNSCNFQWIFFHCWLNLSSWWYFPLFM